MPIFFEPSATLPYISVKIKLQCSSESISSIIVFPSGLTCCLCAVRYSIYAYGYSVQIMELSMPRCSNGTFLMWRPTECSYGSRVLRPFGCFGQHRQYEPSRHYEPRGVAAIAAVKEFPDNRALQAFLSMALYNTQRYKEAMELVLTNLMETTSDERLQYFKRPLVYYASHLDETW